MQTLTLLWPYALLLLPAPWLVSRFVKRPQERTQTFLHAPMMPRLLPFINNLGSPHGKTKWVLLSIMWCLLVLALSRPTIMGEPVLLPREGRNLMLAVDISESMATKDMEIDRQIIDRLTAVKLVLSHFIDQRKGDRLGLLVFGSEVFLHAPFTFDHEVVKRYLKEAQIGFAGPRTAIGDAIGLAVKKAMNQKSGDRILILLTDGQNNTGSLEPEKAAELAKENHLKIYTVGMGSRSIMVDSFLGPTRINPSEDLDASEHTLKDIAKTTNGRYFRATSVDSLQEIYNILDSLEPIKDNDLFIRPQKELFFWPLIGLLLLAVFSLLKNSTWNFRRQKKLERGF